MVRKLFYLFIITMLVACGGSSGTSTSGNATSGRVAIVVTDDLTAVYSEVWVTLYSIEASNGTDTVTLFDNPTGEVINLAELSGVGSLLSVTGIPSGTYTSFEVTLDRDVTLVTNAGVSTVYQLASSDTSSTVSFAITGELVITDGAITTVAIDFDLSKFTIDTSGRVVPVMKLVKDIKKDLKQTMTKIHGEITSLTDTGFVMVTKEGAEVSVIVDDYTLLLMEDDLPLTELTVGMHVKVYGSVDTETLEILATKVKVQSPDSDEDHSTVEVSGTVTSVDTGAVTLNIKHAEFMPVSDTITVIITDTTVFSRGSMDILAEGQELEVKGMLQADGSISATSIEIEGAGHDDMAGHMYAEVKGSVVALDGTLLTVMVDKVDGLDLAIGSESTIDIADAYIKNGTLDDLLADVMVEIKGTVDDTGTFIASMVEIKLSSDMPGSSMSPTMPTGM